MNKTASAPKLMRYIEWMTRGRQTGRTAYVLREWDLPVPLPGAEWAVDPKFNAVEQLQNDPHLKATIVSVLKNGSELVGAVDLKVKRRLSSSLPEETMITDVDLPKRIQNVLALNGIATVGELRQAGFETLLTFQGLGPRSVAFIREHLREP